MNSQRKRLTVVRTWPIALSMGRPVSAQSDDREQFAGSAGSGARRAPFSLIADQRPFHFADLSTVHKVQPMAAFAAKRTACPIAGLSLAGLGRGATFNFGSPPRKTMCLSEESKQVWER